MPFVVGVDVGGTFTDGFASASSGEVFQAKVPSTPDDYSNGVIEVLGELAGATGLRFTDFIRDVMYINHGTTSSLNSLVTGNVAQVGLITTRGHGDMVKIMNAEGRHVGLRGDQIQDIVHTDKPAPQVERRWLREVSERIDYKGAVIVPLDEEGARRAIRELLEGGVEGLAVSLLWGFRNPVHEHRIRELARQEDPALRVILSSECAPRIREYIRTVTTVCSAQLGPGLESYLSSLRTKLESQGFTGRLLVMQSSGGVVSEAQACSQAVTTVGSVLTGGISGCARLGGAVGDRNIISTDMGGTTFLVGIVADGEPVLKATTLVGRYEFAAPSVEVHAIGSGGGAIAWVDPTERLRLGPNSAGAEPGPACYDKGGDHPTVTDAALLLGILNPTYFLGGRKELSVERAAEAMDRMVADRLGLSVEDAAAAVYAVANAQAADLVRRVVIGAGLDPRRFSMYAYGGAAGAHCAHYAAELGIEEVLVPLGYTAATFSAFGLAASDMVLSSEMSVPSEFPLPVEEVRTVFAQLEQDLMRKMESQGLPINKTAIVREVDIRYSMQLGELPTRLSPGEITESSLEELGERFEKLYEDRFGEGVGYRASGLQAISYRAYALGELPNKPMLPEMEGGPAEAAPWDWRMARLDPDMPRCKVPVYRYDGIAARHAINGPAIVETPTTTIVIPARTKGRLDALGNLLIQTKGDDLRGRA